MDGLSAEKLHGLSRTVSWLEKVVWATFIPMQLVLILKSKASSGLAGPTLTVDFFFRANQPADNPDAFPRGYEAQICHNQDAYTGWLWKPGTPTGKATELLTRDDEWFSYRIKAVGNHIEFWINRKLVMTYDDEEYTSGHFAIQGHNPGMKIEANKLYYRDLSIK